MRAVSTIKFVGSLALVASICTAAMAVCLVFPASLYAKQVGGPQEEAEQTATANYHVGAGDVLGIRVFGEPDLSLEAKIPASGIISYPLLGELRVAGQTTAGVETLITKGLKGDFLVDPKVNVTVTEYRSYYVNGEVKTPGAYEYTPGLTVHRAISISGGFTERAARSRILIIKEKDPSRETQRVDLEDPVGPGDIVIVKESFF